MPHRNSWTLPAALTLLTILSAPAWSQENPLRPTPPREASPVPREQTDAQVVPATALQEVPREAKPIDLPALDTPEQQKEFVTSVFAMTKTASAREDYEQLITLCEHGMQANMSDAYAEYLTKLAGWSYNRRGESKAEQATVLARQGKVDEASKWDAQALADFETAVKLDPTRWKSVHNRGVSLALVGEYEQALRDFSKTIELQPGYSNAWFNRAEIRYELERYDDAIADYTEALRLEPEDAGLHISRGHAYFQSRRFQSALQDYDQAVQLDPENAVAVANRADAYRSLGMWQESAADYRRAIQLDEKLGRAYQSAAWLMATCPDERFRNAKLALEPAQRAIQLDGEKDFRYLDTLAVAYANAGEFEQAKAAVSKALAICPAEHEPALAKRLDLFDAEKPYRQEMRTATREAPPTR